VAAGKATFTRPDPEELALAEAAALALLEGEAAGEVGLADAIAAEAVIEAGSDEATD
jgi:hypothetical protein